MAAENETFDHNDAKVLYSQAFHFYNAGLYHKAKDCFRVLTAIQPGNYNYWYGLGATFQMLRDYDNAIQAYSLGALADLEEKDPLPHLQAAECLMAIRKYDRAHIALNSAETIIKQKNYNQKLIEQIEQMRVAIDQLQNK